MDMNTFRHLAFQRVVALLLFTGAGVACIPVASAGTTVDAAFEHELRAALGDSEAVDVALDAARRALTPEAALEAFVQAYSLATGDPNAAHDIARLLQDHPNRFGAPALPLSHAVWTVASSTPQLLLRTANAVRTQETPGMRLVAVDAVPFEGPPVQPTPRTLRAQQARAP